MAPGERNRRVKAKDISRFWAKVDKSGVCWIWIGAVDHRGYGMVKRSGKRIYAHRYSFAVRGMDIPGGMFVDHICRNRSCVNPEHLRVVTTKQNAENRASNYANTSGVRGVNWQKQARKWRALVGHNSKKIYVGMFDTIEEAEAAVIAKRLELHTHNEMDRYVAALEVAA